MVRGLSKPNQWIVAIGFATAAAAAAAACFVATSTGSLLNKNTKEKVGMEISGSRK